MDVAADLVVRGLLAAVETTNECQAGILGQGLARQILLFALLVRHGFEREEGVVRLRTPRLPGELVGFGKLRAGCPRDAQGLARDGVGQGVGDAP